MIQLLIPYSLLSLFSIFNQYGIQPRYGMQQLSYVLIGFIVFFITKKIGRRFFFQNSHFLFILLSTTLIFTYFIGLEVKGSRRWIDLGFVNFQPSEFLKIVYILYFATIFAEVKKDSITPFFFLRSTLIALFPFIVVLRQPDLGNAMVLLSIYIFLLFFSDIPKKYITTSLVVCIILLPFIWFFLRDYQQVRILSFFSPHTDTRGNSYNMIQSIITVGSGQLEGKGFGLGTQSRLFFLPENNTDFAFASLVEQFGFIGGFVVILLEFSIIGLLLKRGFKFIQGQDTDTRFKFLFASGLACMFFVQIVVNIGMNLGLLPIAGIALPFVSFGGSFVVSALAGFAMLKT